MSFRLDHFTFHYDSPQGPRLALDDVSVDLPGGQVIAVLGPSGCGKTTLLNCLGLLEEKDPGPGRVFYSDGKAEVDYHDLAADPARRARLRREEFGVVLQNCYLLPHFTNLQNVCLPLALLGWAEDEQRAWAEALLRKVDLKMDLWGARGKMPREVSLGQRQRMAVLRAVVHNPRVVFADEPISNLDRTSTHAVLQLLLDWQSGHLLRDCVTDLLDEPGAAPPGLLQRLEAWRGADPGPRSLLLVCHHLDVARDCADLALLFDEHHTLHPPFARARWAELEQTLNHILAYQPLERRSP